MSRAMRPAMRRAALVVTALAVLAACHDESRRPRTVATASQRGVGTKTPTIEPGPSVPPPSPPPPSPIEATTYAGPYDDNAWAMAEGKRMYAWFNCTGCHGHGGGGSGPALMDASWRYGSAPRDIFASIALGRPNGMPAFRDRIPEDDVWKLVAYVRSLSGLANHVAAPGRGDSLSYKHPESRKDEER